MYDAAIRLAHYLAVGGLDRELSMSSVRHGAVLELGCGVGLVGLTAAALGANAVLTDCSQRAVQLARRNAEENGLQNSTEVLQWAWGDDPQPLKVRGPFQLILMSDVVYREELVKPLVGALDKLLDRGIHGLLAYSLRGSPVHRFFSQELSCMGFKLQRVDPPDTNVPGVHKIVHFARVLRS